VVKDTAAVAARPRVSSVRTPARAFTREALAHIAQLAAKVATGYVRIRDPEGQIVLDNGSHINAAVSGARSASALPRSYAAYEIAHHAEA